MVSMRSCPQRANPIHGANLGFEAEMWRMADALRGSMDAAEYKHVVVGPIFPKYISDAFEEHRQRLGRVYDPCYGSAGMFVQSMEFIEAHATGNGGRPQISIYGQELNYTTWHLAKMNPAIRGIDSCIEQGDTFHNDRLPDLKADLILADPPFNMKGWGDEGLQEDEPFEVKMAWLVAQLREQQAEARRLDEAIWKGLRELGYET